MSEVRSKGCSKCTCYQVAGPYTKASNCRLERIGVGNCAVDSEFERNVPRCLVHAKDVFCAPRLGLWRL